MKMKEFGPGGALVPGAPLRSANEYDLYFTNIFPPAQLEKEYLKKTIILWSTTYFSEIPDDLRSDKDCLNGGQELCEMITDKSKYMVGGQFWLAQNFGKAVGPTNVICHSVNVERVVVLLGGGGNTSTLHAVTKLV